MGTEQELELAERSLYCRDVIFQWSNRNGTGSTVLQDITVESKKGELVSFLGPSGCGKTTLMRVLCGLLLPQTGEVGIGSIPIAAPTKKVGIVFQDSPLFPWLTVQGNVEFGMRINHISAVERSARSKEILGRVGLWSDRRHFPHELSGGMRQRTAIAQVLANEPECILMDEPFGALDFQTRYLMQQLVLDIQRQFRKTVFLVTHQVDEAIVLSDRIFLMAARPGRIVDEVYIDLPRPRVVTGDRFNDYRKRITAHLEKEVTKVFQTQHDSAMQFMG